MSHAEKCPVCKGSGETRPGQLDRYQIETLTCHGCEGKGWVEVSDGPPPMPAWTPQIPVQQPPDRPSYWCDSKRPSWHMVQIAQQADAELLWGDGA